MTVEVYAFHKKGLKPPIKKTMSYGDGWTLPIVEHIFSFIA